MSRSARILGLWPGVRVWVSRLIRSRTRSVVQGASCLGDRAPARISAITWANCLDHATTGSAPPTGSAAPAAGRPALNVREGPGGSAPSGAPQLLVGTRARHGYLARRRARGAVHLAVIRRPAAGYLNQAQPAEGGRRSRRSSRRRSRRRTGRRSNRPAADRPTEDRPSRRARVRWLTWEMPRQVPGRECGQTACSAFQSGECERPRTPVTASAYSPAAHGCTSGHRHSGVLAGH